MRQENKNEETSKVNKGKKSAGMKYKEGKEGRQRGRQCAGRREAV